MAAIHKAKEQPLLDATFKLERYPGKGGWTYVTLPPVLRASCEAFGWVKVKGQVDDVAFKGIRLMPMKGGRIFFPVKAAWRKQLGKSAGATVRILLYADTEPLVIPEELSLCLDDNPIERDRFLSYTEGQQKRFIDYIFSAKTEATRVQRITRTLDLLARGEKYPSPISKKQDHV